MSETEGTDEGSLLPGSVELSRAISRPAGLQNRYVRLSHSYGSSRGRSFSRIFSFGSHRALPMHCIMTVPVQDRQVFLLLALLLALVMGLRQGRLA